LAAKAADFGELKLASFVETQGFVASKFPRFQQGLPDPNTLKSMIFLSYETALDGKLSILILEAKNHLLLRVSLRDDYFNIASVRQ
jgi:hypothetical protein